MKSIGKVLHLFRKSPLYELKAAWILGSRPGYARRQARHGSWHGGFIFPKVFINDLLFSNRDYAPGLNFVRITTKSTGGERTIEIVVFEVMKLNFHCIHAGEPGSVRFQNQLSLTTFNIHL